jgi:hypothetical protein
LLFTTTDRFLRASFYNFRQSNGYLYPFGDSSIAVVSNVQTSGSPPSTSFTYQNTDPQIGTRWRDTCQDFSRTTLFANEFSAYGLYGGAVTKITSKLDRIFQNAILPTTSFPTDGQPVFPSAAVANIFDIKVYCLLMEIINPITALPQKSLLMWNERDWTIATSEVDLNYIGTREIASDLSAWGTDGNSIYELFTTPSPTLPKMMASKLYGSERSLITKQAMAFYCQATDIEGTGLTFDLTIENESGGWPVPAENGLQNWSAFVAAEAGTPPPIPPNPDAPLLAARGLDVIGQQLGWTLSTPPSGTSGDFEILNCQMAITEIASVFG